MRLIALSLLVAACEGPAGPTGPSGSSGDAGVPTDGDKPLAPWRTAPDVDIHVTDLVFANNVASVDFTLTDGAGVGLDKAGLLTDSVVDVSFVVAQLGVLSDGSPAQYTAYTTVVQTSPITGTSAIQASTESSGTLNVLNVALGTYRYDVAAPLAGFDPSLTQTVGALAVRGASISRDTHSVRPDNGTVAVREVVTSATCDSCHRALDAHGGRWTQTTQCVLCHQPQSSDPDTGNTIDFKVMVHKIHRGSSLPSVVGGTPYQIIGYMQSINEFSKVEFPQNIARCAACHAGAQGDRWETSPSKPACTSCHDTTSFVLPVPAGMVPHSGGPQPDNAMCAVCHPATGSLAGIADKHLVGLLSPTAPTVALAISGITHTLPGQTPTLTFQVMVNGAPRDLIASPLSGLVVALAGPTSDVAGDWETTIQGSDAAGTLTAIDASAGTYSYVFPASAAIPDDATGSFMVALEGYVQPTSADPRYAADNPVLTFAVTDTTPQPRREIVAVQNCNGCHYDLAVHGGTRKNTKYCVFCHDPSEYDGDGTARFQTTTNVLADTIDFRHMIHKIHAGSTLSQPYVMGGFPFPSETNPAGTPNDFSNVQYPRDLRDCAACHTSKNWTLPLPATYMPSTSALMSCDPAGGNDPTAFCPDPFWTAQEFTTPPATSVCTSCHDSPAVAAHAQLNTTTDGVEACAVCHGTGKAYDVGVLHGL